MYGVNAAHAFFSAGAKSARRRSRASRPFFNFSRLHARGRARPTERDAQRSARYEAVGCALAGRASARASSADGGAGEAVARLAWRLTREERHVPRVTGNVNEGARVERCNGKRVSIGALEKLPARGICTAYCVDAHAEAHACDPDRMLWQWSAARVPRAALAFAESVVLCCMVGRAAVSATRTF
eukprot:IDg17777t1